MPRVLIIGGDADHNLGDLAILMAVCQTIRTFDAHIEITATLNHTPKCQLPAVTQVIARGARNFGQLMRAARAHSLVLVGGGGLLQDDDSRVKMPYWAARLSALKLVNSNLAAHSIGAGPLHHWESRACARLICQQLVSITVRDEFAHTWLQPCTRKPVGIVPDPAFMLQPATAEAARDYLHSAGVRVGRPLIGVVLRRWFHRLGGFVPHRLRSQLGLDGGSGQKQLQVMLRVLATEIAAHARELDADLILLPTYNVAHEADAAVCRQFAGYVGNVHCTVALIDDPSLYKAVTGHLALMVSARMHPMILAAGMGVPVVGLAYNGKFTGLFNWLGVAPKLLWMKDFTPDAAIQFKHLLSLASADSRDHLQQRTAELAGLSRRSLAEVLRRSSDLRLRNLSGIDGI